MNHVGDTDTNQRERVSERRVILSLIDEAEHYFDRKYPAEPRRHDWRTRQLVDKVVAQLHAGGLSPEDARLKLTDALVPLHVQNKVLLPFERVSISVNQNKG